MKTIIYLVLFTAIASVTSVTTQEKKSAIIQEVPKTKVDSLLQLADKVEKKIDKNIMKKISHSNSKIDSLERVVRLQNIEIRKYKKLLNKRK